MTTQHTPSLHRVLIVEDNLDQVQTLAFLLRRSGHTVEFAINGYAALTIAARWQPDFVFLDIGLPDFDGCALVRRLKRLPHLEKTRFIAITGRVSEHDQERALAAGCERFLRKPISVQSVEEALAASAPNVGPQPSPIRPARGA